LDEEYGIWNCIGKRLACEETLNDTREIMPGQSILSLNRLAKNLRFIKRLRSERHFTDKNFLTGKSSRGRHAISNFWVAWRIHFLWTLVIMLLAAAVNGSQRTKPYSKADRTNRRNRALKGETRLNSNDTRWIHSRSVKDLRQIFSICIFGHNVRVNVKPKSRIELFDVFKVRLLILLIIVLKRIGLWEQSKVTAEHLWG